MSSNCNWDSKKFPPLSHISVIRPLMPKNFCHTTATPPQYGCSSTYLAYFMSSSTSKSLSTSYLWKFRKISLLWIVRIWFYLGQNNEMATTIDSMVILQYFWIKLNQLAQVIGAKRLAPRGIVQLSIINCS